MKEQEFRALGRPMNAPSKELDTFPTPEHVTLVRFTSDELSAFCPVTHQPDFYKLDLEFVPNERCIESKSLKLYLWSFREEQCFGEALASTIAKDIVAAIDPHSVKVTLTQNIRGGLQLTAVAELHRKTA